MEHRYTGRREDRRLVTGAGMFTADWDRSGVLHAAFLRTDRAHARIISTDVASAQAAPGICAVLTGADMQAAGYTRGLPLMPLGRGEALKAIVAPALALGRVRYVGEPVAIVVADSLHAAQDASELIQIDYDSLPAVVSGRAALAQDAPLLHEEIPGNLCYGTDYGDRAATQAAFAAARHIVRVAQESGRIVGNPMEPKAAMAAWDGNILELWSPSQGMTGMRDGLAALAGLTPDTVARPRAGCRRRVRRPRSGLSGICRPGLGREANRATGEMGREPVGDVPQRLSRPRRFHGGRTGAGCRRMLPRHPA